VWAGALTGAGVNVVGGALLDSITGEKVRQKNQVQRMPPTEAYGTGYEDGYKNGYKAGYNAAFEKRMPR
jgi:flagellar biosynthesis/type III secretory pathway protein FliH